MFFRRDLDGFIGNFFFPSSFGKAKPFKKLDDQLNCDSKKRKTEVKSQKLLNFLEYFFKIESDVELNFGF